jgi:hypothetical protein
MIKRFIIITACIGTAALLCSCAQGQYLSVGYNRQSRVYAPAIAEVNDASYSYDLYQNPALPLKQYDSGIYYYFMSSYDEFTPPLLSVIDPSNGDVRTLCTDENCYHKKVNYTTRCILCDIYDTSRLTMLGGNIYYARADKSYYNEKQHKLDYVINSDQDTVDEVEFKYTLIEYNLASGKYKECYTVEPSGYIDFITGSGNYIFFYETSYELIENQEYSFNTLKKDPDGVINGSYWFIDDTNGQYVLYDATLFYDKATVGDMPYRNIKVNRKMLLKDNKPWVKVYKLQRLNTKTDKIDTLAIRDSLPDTFDIFDGRIYESRAEGYFSYDLDYNVEYEIPAQPGAISILNASQAEGITSCQYDQFTANIYYLKDGSLSKVKKAGEAYRSVRTADLCRGSIVWYQLTFEGIYFMLDGDNNIYIAEYTDINYSDVPYKAAYTPEEKFTDAGGEVLWPTVVGDYIYMAKREYRTFTGRDGSDSETVPIITGLFRYSCVSGKTTEIWPDGWELAS